MHDGIDAKYTYSIWSQNFSVTRSQLRSTFTTNKAIAGAFAENPLARQRIVEFYQLIQPVSLTQETGCSQRSTDTD